MKKGKDYKLYPKKAFRKATRRCITSKRYLYKQSREAKRGEKKAQKKKVTVTAK